MSSSNADRVSRIPCLVVALLCCAGAARAQEATGDAALDFERTPPRLSFLEGDVSFWRPGAEEWAPARINIALAPGDQLYGQPGANFELQIGPGAFVRAGNGAQLGLESQEPDSLQLRLGAGLASLDVRSLRAGLSVEIDTPNASFTIAHTGYYRVEIDGDTTHLVSRRGGRASVATADGQISTIAPSEEAVVSGVDAPQIATYAAPDLDAWDRWNYERSEDLVDAVSSRYVPSGVYGIDDLDHYGRWRVVASYGPVWFPSVAAAGWVPYSTGRWMWDPLYGWTWVDDAPWGWAPFHYGRWVYAGGYWGWAPGPLVTRVYYAPALVAFFSRGSVALGISVGSPAIGWVALGWGEPCLPWWGPPRLIGHPHWLGWGGPRVVNRVVIDRRTVVKADTIHLYENERAPHALVALQRDRFGRDRVEGHRLTGTDDRTFAAIHGRLPLEAVAVSRVGGPDRGRRPPAPVLERRVVAARPAPPLETGARGQGPAKPRVVKTPAQEPSREAEQVQRPPFGREAGPERSEPPPPPRFEDVRRREQAMQAPSLPAAPAPPAPSPQRKVSAHQAQAAPVAPPQPAHAASDAHPPTELPGEPANRVYEGRRRGEEAPPSAASGSAPQGPKGHEAGPPRKVSPRGGNPRDAE
jgi:hypothetical protein